MATEVDPVLLGREATEPLIEHAVHLGVLLVDPNVLGSGVPHKRAETAHRCDRVHALPEQVSGVHLRPHVSGTDLVDESLEGRRVEHHVLGVHLDGNFDAVVGRQGVDLAPEGHRNLIWFVKSWWSRFRAGGRGRGRGSGTGSV